MVNNIISEKWPAEHTVILELNRPEHYNALNMDLLLEMEKCLEKQKGDDARVLIITGADKSFSSGADLKEIRAYSSQEMREFSLTGHRVLKKIEDFPCPVIAAVNGYALGGGCELACSCDLIYAAESAKFGQPESKVGLIPGWGGTFRLPRHIGVVKAKELVFTGSIIAAGEAADTGLVNAVFPDDQFMDKVLEIAEQIVKNAPIANRLSKKMLNRYQDDIESLIDEESLALAFCASCEDGKEGIEAFLAKREPVFQNR
ncbi:MAG: enoyl-CoA hydratase/isomerase family protein [Fidelibacterota bacterium]|nr:MAG: enoyl-CoA hydratase/isomerase family protein [Candidatus Neomarinimicrobiota bacterium]